MLTFNISVFVFSVVMVALFSQRTRWGVGPMFLVMGVLLAFISVTGRIKILVPVPGGAQAYMGSLLHLSAILVGVMLVYALEGTKMAQRTIIGLGLAMVVLYIARETMAWQLKANGDITGYGRKRWLNPKPWATVVSAVSLMADGIVIIVAYQAMQNLARGRRALLPFAFGLALSLAMVADGLVYGGLSGRFDGAQFAAQLWGKLTTGLVACIPPSLYILYEFKRHPDRVEGGLINRSAFEVVTLKRQLKQVRTELEKSQVANEHIRSVFGRYVAPDVVDEILESGALELGGELKDVTIVFSDIRGYSTLSEQMSPVQTIDLLNEYFSAMGEVITHFRGTIIEFEGDAILVVFGAPLTQEDHANRAVRAALMMLEVVDELNTRWERDGTAQLWKRVGIPKFKVRLGIHSGQVVVGNVGSQRRTKYAAIGDAVNTAARVESMNKTLGTSLLMTEQTQKQLDIPSLKFVDKGEHAVRGRREPVRVLTVKGLAHVD